MKKRPLPQRQDESPRCMGPCVRRDDSLKRHAYENFVCDSLPRKREKGKKSKRPAISRPLSRIIFVRARASQTAAVIHCCGFCFGAAPTWREAISPPLKIITRGEAWRRMHGSIYKLRRRRAAKTAAIRRFKEAGYSIQQIVKQYPTLTVEDVQAALVHEEGLARSA
jgi:hypothetical protein